MLILQIKVFWWRWNLTVCVSGDAAQWRDGGGGVWRASWGHATGSNDYHDDDDDVDDDYDDDDGGPVKGMLQFVMMMKGMIVIR